jgi:hypothetical protein
MAGRRCVRSAWRVVACGVLCMTWNAAFCSAQFGDVFRIWQDSTGNFSVRARLVAVEDHKAKLEKEDGKQIVVPLERLNAVDREFVRKQPAQNPGQRLRGPSKENPKENPPEKKPKHSVNSAEKNREKILSSLGSEKNLFLIALAETQFDMDLPRKVRLQLVIKGREAAADAMVPFSDQRPSVIVPLAEYRPATGLSSQEALRVFRRYQVVGRFDAGEKQVALEAKSQLERMISGKPVGQTLIVQTAVVQGKRYTLDYRALVPRLKEAVAVKHAISVELGVAPPSRPAMGGLGFGKPQHAPVPGAAKRALAK